MMYTGLDALGVSQEEREIAKSMPLDGIDPAVSVLIAATNGNAYKHIIGTQFDYPIPDFPHPRGNGRTLLDIGCSWGRWSIAADRKGYLPTGLDPSVGAIAAARRVADRFGANARFMVGDAKALPFPDASFDAVFSYSVLQHFSLEHARCAFAEIGRVLKPGGTAKVQMANWLGLRSLYVQAKRGFRVGRDFEVRYWRLKDLRTAFDDVIGPTTITPHCFFGLGLEQSDISLLRPVGALLVRVSDMLVALSGSASLLADSVYLTANKGP